LRAVADPEIGFERECLDDFTVVKVGENDRAALAPCLRRDDQIAVTRRTGNPTIRYPTCVAK
jgi:hypothetical protein